MRFGGGFNRFPGPPCGLTWCLPVRATETTPSDSACTRQGTSKGHQKVNNKKESKEMNKKDD